MQYGADYDRLLEMEAGGYPVSALDNEPESNPIIEFYMGIHSTLVQGSHHEFGRISFTDLHSYSEMFDIKDIETLVKFVQGINIEYVSIQIKEHNKRMEEQARKAKQKAKQG